VVNGAASQLESPGLRLLNLSEAEVRRLMATTPLYADARLVADAYDRNEPAEWVAAVHAQAVLGGNIAFAAQHAQLSRPSGSFYVELVRRYKGDPQVARTPAAAANLRRTLETCADTVVQFRLAEDLRLSEVTDALTAAVPGILVRATCVCACMRNCVSVCVCVCVCVSVLGWGGASAYARAVAWERRSWCRPKLFFSVPCNNSTLPAGPRLPLRFSLSLSPTLLPTIASREGVLGAQVLTNVGLVKGDNRGRLQRAAVGRGPRRYPKALHSAPHM
jgi:hypothetical protein